jgi:hypothetical protein
MNDGIQRFSSLARAILATGLLAGAMSAGLALAGEEPASPSAPAAKPQVVTIARGLGTVGNPILLPPTEASAVRIGPPAVGDRVEFRIGMLLGALAGTAGVSYAPGGSTAPMGDAPWGWDQDMYSGGGIELGHKRSSAVHLESGLVMLHDPMSVLSYGSFTCEYWSSSAGLLVRF